MENKKGAYKMTDTVYEEDSVLNEHTQNKGKQYSTSPKHGKVDPPKDSKPKKSIIDLPWGTIGAIAGVILIIGVIIGALWLLLFAPVPTANTEEAAQTIQQDLTSALSTARAYEISNEGSNVSMLTVETEEGTCMYFRSRGDGLYQVFEIEARVAPGYLNFEPINYTQAYSPDSDPTFEYHHSEEQLRHGVYADLVIGGGFAGDPRSVSISQQYPANPDVTSESYCFG